jgi:hypothetical protein
MFSLRYPRFLLLFAATLIANSQPVTAQVKMGANWTFVNLKLLKPAEVSPQMTAYTRALGINCGNCHLPGDYATDELSNKVIARQMIILTKDINAKNFGGAERVTCYTCHHGRTVPETKQSVQ